MHSRSGGYTLCVLCISSFIICVFGKRRDGRIQKHTTVYACEKNGNDYVLNVDVCLCVDDWHCFCHFNDQMKITMAKLGAMKMLDDREDDDTTDKLNCFHSSYKK